jgi:hypothetical protein
LSILANALLKATHGVSVERETLGRRRRFRTLGEVAGNANCQAAFGCPGFGHGPKILLDEMICVFLKKSLRLGIGRREDALTGFVAAVAKKRTMPSLVEMCKVAPVRVTMPEPQDAGRRVGVRRPSR